MSSCPSAYRAGEDPAGVLQRMCACVCVCVVDAGCVGAATTRGWSGSETTTAKASTRTRCR
eukprot:592981-Rhodomonas_salina.3